MADTPDILQTEPRTITLDGPAGVGKSTLAKRVAEELGIAFLDTGAMFRAVAWHLGEEGRNLSPEALSARLGELDFSLSGAGEQSQVVVNGQVPGDELRSEKVGLLASTLATLPAVREFLKQAQRAIAHRISLVAEGRDMGTVVFPDASHKFFLDASPEERARRRYRQLKEMGKPADLDEITLQLKIRDAQDRNRPIAPLKPADDAVCIDTTHLDIEGVFSAIMEHLADWTR